ncbi:MAG TPA: ABC transporter ATP-binding protein [Bacteroidales bacterium]|nr:ABC transporter ATP-binding protein [Bacteroidales bacterium]
MLGIRNVTKKYYKGAMEFTALDNVSLEIRKGDYIVISGPSGAGKSTLLYIAGGMIRPDSGEVLYNGGNIYNLAAKEKNEYRKKHVGFVFQQFHLMPFLTVKENIMLACYEKSLCAKIDTLMEQCSLTGLRDKYPSELSVGEKQRTAFLRAIITEPEILLADEPTGNLDPANSEILMSLMNDFNKKGGTILLVSHSPEASKYAQKKISLINGKIVINH